MDRIYTIISAIFTALSYQFFGPGVLISLTPFLIKKPSPKTFFLWGITYMGALHLFLFELHEYSNITAALLLWLLTSIFYGAFYGMGGVLLKTIEKKTQLSWQHLLPIVWPLIEILKSGGSFGNSNGNLGFSFAYFIDKIPSISVIGHIGIGIIIVAINCCILNIYIKNQQRKNIIFILILFIILLGVSSPKSIEKIPSIVNVIQTDVKQSQKLNSRHWPSIEKEYTKLLNQATGNIIILPESILPYDIKQTPFFETLQKQSNKKDQHILFGSFIQEGQTIYNGSYLIQPNDSSIEYKKQRLMPFGESLPLRPIFSKVIPKKLLFNDFAKGTNFIDHPIKSLSIRPLICLEGIYSNFFRSNKKSIVAVLANNAWFNDSSAGEKLLTFSQVHAAEYNIPVLISANYGKSAIIEYNGKIKQIAHHQTSDILKGKIKINTKKTIYHRYPWLGPVGLITLWLLFKFKSIKNNIKT